MSWIDNIPDFTDNAKDNLDAVKNNLGLLEDSQIVDDNLDDDNPSNGYYVRWKNGLQICWHEITLTYDGADNLRENWNFPADFDSIPACFANWDSSTSYIFINGDEISILRAFNPTTTDVSPVVLYRQKGERGFEDGDTADVSVLAVGRKN